MGEIKVQLHKDYLNELTKVKPKEAISELIWNSLDADAEKVKVTLIKNQLDNIDKVIVEDDGVGLKYENAKDYFGQLGYSWKKNKNKTQKGRVLHGKIGRGRFLAFKIGSQIEWKFTTTAQNGKNEEFSIEKEINKNSFFVSELKEKVNAKTGTKVSIYNISEKCQNLLSFNSIKNYLLKTFSLYLLNYQTVSIIYDDNELEPNKVIKNREKQIINIQEIPNFSFELEIIEWDNINNKGLCLCNSDGFYLYEENLNINTGDLEITAYLKSDFFKDFAEDKYLLRNSDNIYQDVMKKARKKIKNYCEKRQVEISKNVIDKWKIEGIYPFKNDPKTKIEDTKRQIFNLVALNVNEYLPKFSKEDTSNKKLTLRLLREAIESNPKSTTKILQEIFDLPEEKINEFAELLERTTLSSIISASKLIADRLDFLTGLQTILFQNDYKKALKERSQLHKIISQNTWIFGEEYFLSANDKSLTSVLKEYIKDNNLEIDYYDNIQPVLDSEGKNKIIDLMLARSIPQPDKMKKKYIVIELKRPSQDIGDKELSQVKNYARTISNDDRFKATNTEWEFWAVSNNIAESAKDEVYQNGRPPGLVLPSKNYKIWVKPWAQIIRECESRLSFFDEQLKLEVTNETGMSYLKTLYNKYLPDITPHS